MRRRYTGRKRRRTTYRRRYASAKKRRFGKRTYGRPKTEVKFYDFILTDASLSLVGQNVVKSTPGPATVSNTIVDIPQGVSAQQRIGRKCTITKILGRINFEFLPDVQTDMLPVGFAHESVRFILYWDKQCNGAAAGVTALLKDNAYNSYRNMNNLKRFTVLYDKIFTFNTTAVAAGGAESGSAGVLLVEATRVIKDYNISFALNVFIPIEYSGITGAITELSTNNIGILVWTKHGARMAIRASPMRLRFIDL